jgi:integrase
MAIKTIEKNGKKIYEVYVNGLDSRGRRVQKKKRGIGTLRKAEVAEFEIKRELAKLREEQVPYYWHEWLDECLKRMKIAHRPSTVINYNSMLGKWITPKWKKVFLNQITKMQIYSAIFEETDKKLSPYTRRTILKMVRRIFQMAVEEGILIKNPTIGIQCKVPEADQKVLTNKEVEIFLREAKHTNHRFYPIWALALMTGMRSGEMFALRWVDIDFEAKLITVSRQWTNKNGFGPTKTQKSRIVPLSDELLKFLIELKLKHSAKREFVLPQLSEWEHGDQAKVTKDFCRSLGITPVKFHDLRATFITNLLARGESLARVMAIVGHTQIKTTNTYLRRAGVELTGATDRLGYGLPDDEECNVLSLKSCSVME